MKRKLVSILLCVSMVGVLAAGCGDKESAESTEDTGKTEGTENTDSGEDQEEGLLDLGLDLESVTVATSPGYARQSSLRRPPRLRTLLSGFRIASGYRC